MESGRSRAPLRLLQKGGRVNHAHSLSRAREGGLISAAVSIRRRRRQVGGIVGSTRIEAAGRDGLRRFCALAFRVGGPRSLFLSGAAPTILVADAGRRLGCRRFYLTLFILLLVGVRRPPPPISKRGRGLSEAWPSDVLVLWIMESGRSRAPLRLLQKGGRVNHAHSLSRAREGGLISAAVSIRRRRRQVGGIVGSTRIEAAGRDGLRRFCALAFRVGGPRSLFLSGAAPTILVADAGRRLGCRRFYLTLFILLLVGVRRPPPPISKRGRGLSEAWPSDVLVLWIMESGRSRAPLRLLQKGGRVNHAHSLSRAREGGLISAAVSIRRRRRQVGGIVGSTRIEAAGRDGLRRFCALAFRVGGPRSLFLSGAAPTILVADAGRRLGCRRFYLTLFILLLVGVRRPPPPISKRGRGLSEAWPSDVLVLWIMESGRSRAPLRLLQKGGRVNHAHSLSRAREGGLISAAVSIRRRRRQVGGIVGSTRIEAAGRDGLRRFCALAFRVGGPRSLFLSGAAPTILVADAGRRLGCRRFYLTLFILLLVGVRRPPPPISKRGRGLSEAWPSDVLVLWIMESGRSRAPLRLLQKGGRVNHAHSLSRAREGGLISAAVSIRRRRRQVGVLSARPGSKPLAEMVSGVSALWHFGLAGRALYSLAERRRQYWSPMLADDWAAADFI